MKALLNYRQGARPFTAITCTAVLVLFVFAPILVAAEANAPLTASITKVKGQSVQVSTDKAATWKAAKVGESLSKDAQIRTGFGSECEVSFANHTVVQVQSLSSLKIADYSGTAPVEKVRATVQYGAVRCGVEKGRITPDTQINTPVSTLSIRGTVVYVEYDPGTRRCTLWTVEKGPALAQTSEGKYELDEGMDTDCSLSRHLERAMFRRQDWIQGNQNIGSVTDRETSREIYQGGETESNDREHYTQSSSFDGEIHGGDVPIGGSIDK